MRAIVRDVRDGRDVREMREQVRKLSAKVLTQPQNKPIASTVLYTLVQFLPF